MPIAITDAHRDLEEVARGFLAKVNARGEARALLDAADETFAPFWPSLVEMGWLGLHLPEEYGGGGFGLPELAVVLQEMGRADAPGPYLPTVLASSVLARLAEGALAKELVPALADGSRLGACSWGPGLELSHEGMLNGALEAVLGAGLADLFVLTCGDDVVVIDRSSSGLTVQVAGNLDPTRRCGKIEARDVAVSEERILRGGARTTLSLARTIVAAEAAGGAQACVEQASAYAKQRLQFGRVIGAFQAVKHHCANMLVSAERSTAAVWDAARAAEGSGDQFDLASAVALTEAVPAYLKNAQLNIQVHGGIGFTWEHDGHMLLRRAATLVAVADAHQAARDVTRLSQGGVQREFGLDLPPEAELLREGIRASAEEIAGLPSGEQRARLIDTGYVQPHWPKPWGRAAGALEQLVIEEEFASAGVTLPQFGITAWNVLTLIQHANPDQIERWVRPTLEGDLVWCQLFSEPDAGSDAAGIRTKATRVDGGFLINGQKVWTSGAQVSHRGLATVRTDPDAPKHNGITAVVIDMHAPGVEVRPLREASGASMFNEVFFNDVFVPDDDVVGPVNGGWTVARSTLGNERVSIGGGGVVPMGLESLVLQEVGEDGFASSHEAVGEFLAEHLTLRAVNLRAAARAIAGGEPGPEGNVTKLLSAEHMQRGADLALELLGPKLAVLDGPGFIAAQVLIFSRAMTIAGGTSEITRNQIGERILGLPRDPLIA
jgi:alkylation response protein AidB-like acyl-CoA dehydrogenase